MTKSLWVGLGVVCLLAGCESQVCTPGSSVACVGAGGCAGGQVCNAEGTGFGACDCGGTTDAGTDAGGDDDAGITDTPVPVDTPAPDAPTVCDPITQAGCDDGERCAYRASDDSRVCVAGAGIAVGESCDESGAVDPCEAGSRCLGDRCVALCLVAGDDRCEATEACVRYDALIGADRTDVGACLVSCDLLTQLRPDATPCPAGRGCYAVFTPESTTLTCAADSSTLTHGDVVPGAPVGNACAPGHMILLDATGTQRCAALCRPAETSTASPGMVSGVAPYACSGAAAGLDCIYLWSVIQMSPPDERLADVGVCFDRTGHLIDDDGDLTAETPRPSCATRSNADGPDPDDVPEHVELGCAPYPG